MCIRVCVCVCSLTMTWRQASDRSTTATAWRGRQCTVLMSLPQCRKSLQWRPSTYYTGGQVRKYFRVSLSIKYSQPPPSEPEEQEPFMSRELMSSTVVKKFIGDSQPLGRGTLVCREIIFFDLIDLK